MADILGYSRVSTEKQDLEAQHIRLKEAGAIKIFDDVISGRKFDRQGLTELLAYARKGDVLCVVRLDRLGRSLRELLEIVDDMKSQGLHLKSLEEEIDSSTATGELIFHVFGAIAHFERRLNSERTKDGLRAAAARGKKPGRPRLDTDVLASAVKLVEAGIAPSVVARQLNIGRSTIYRELKKAA